MTWQSLSTTLNGKPRVLAGPMLRKTTSSRVTVWLALKDPAQVTLSVLDGSGRKLLGGARHTVAVGLRLHIVAVTASPLVAGTLLVENTIYRYDLSFDFADKSGVGLAEATGMAPQDFAYAPYTTPSFCLPPQDLNHLRVLQGSCRIPHAEGADALALGDALLRETAADPLQRPQQLLLNGDQIYADDVAPAMLVMLSDAAVHLLGWQQTLAVPAAFGGPQPAERLPPYLRRKLLDDSGFTSEDLDAHLMSLGEYLAMYLFVWSDVLWAGDSLPSRADLLQAGAAGIHDPAILGQWRAQRDLHRNEPKEMETHAERMQLFREAIPAVRRLLANVPSYMIFDDHEVTDDWNMTRDFCHGVYGRPLGVQVVQNALVAYALCQHWGNAPEQFEAAAAPPQPAGQRLLDLLAGGSAASYEQNAGQIAALVGVHDDAALRDRPDKGVFHDADSLLYNYTIEGPGHQVIVTDTRSWRVFPFGSSQGGELLSREQLVLQIERTPELAGRALLVVLTTNAPPVQPIRTATRHDTITNLFAHHPDVYEAWDLPSVAFDRLVVALSNKLPRQDGRRQGCVVLLSGDVHFSFASRLLYRATTRFGDDAAQPATVVLAQLVASSVRKQTSDTVGMHREGYEYGPNFFARWLIPGHHPEGYVGWNALAGSERAIGQKGLVHPTFVPLVTERLDQPTLQVAPDGFFLGVGVDPATPPDYSYRLDYLVADKASEEGAPLPMPPVGTTPAERLQAAAIYSAACARLEAYNVAHTPQRQIVGVNNLGLLDFDWDMAAHRGRQVRHTLLWKNGIVVDTLRTRYTVSLDAADPLFPEIQPRRLS